MRGCKSFLAYVQNVSAESPQLDSVPVVREFFDIFPTDLPGFPLERDVEFIINLESGT